MPGVAIAAYHLIKGHIEYTKDINAVPGFSVGKLKEATTAAKHGNETLINGWIIKTQGDYLAGNKQALIVHQRLISLKHHIEHPNENA